MLRVHWCYCLYYVCSCFLWSLLHNFLTIGFRNVLNQAIQQFYSYGILPIRSRDVIHIDYSIHSDFLVAFWAVNNTDPSVITWGRISWSSLKLPKFQQGLYSIGVIQMMYNFSPWWSLIYRHSSQNIHICTRFLLRGFRSNFRVSR